MEGSGPISLNKFPYKAPHLKAHVYHVALVRGQPIPSYTLELSYFQKPRLWIRGIAIRGSPKYLLISNFVVDETTPFVVCRVTHNTSMGPCRPGLLHSCITTCHFTMVPCLFITVENGKAIDFTTTTSTLSVICRLVEGVNSMPKGLKVSRQLIANVILILRHK